MHGLDNDGLLQRFQLLVYPDEVKNWELVDKSPDTLAKERAHDVFKKIACMDFIECGATQGDFDAFPYFHFSEDAQTLFNEWLTELETKTLKTNDHPILLEHFGKYRSLMPSLALILHLIDVADGSSSGSVSLSAAEKAAGFCEYLESHARRIYGLVVNIDQQAASALAKKIQDGKLSDGFTIRDIYRKNWHLLNTKELARVACDELMEAGWLKKESTPPAFGRKEKVEYKINPKIKS